MSTVGRGYRGSGVVQSNKAGRAFGWLLVLLFVGLTAHAAAPEAAPSEAARINKLDNSLLAPCCFGEPVSRHMSDVAIQMRKEIAERVAAGESDREILDHYKELYGEEILVEPEGTKRVVLYTLPVMVLFVGFAVVLAFLRHATKGLTMGTKRTEMVDRRLTEIIRRATDEG